MLSIPTCPLCGADIIQLESLETMPTDLVHKNRRVVGRTRTRPENELVLDLECETGHRFRVSGLRHPDGSVTVADGQSAQVISRFPISSKDS